MFVLDWFRMNRDICFVGDLFAGGTLLHEEPKDRVRSSVYREADIRIANLEHAIGTGDPIPKKSTLHSPPKAIEYLKELSIDAVSLANNHIHDLGPSGITETVTRLQSAGIDCFGAGKSIQEAAKPYQVNDELVVIGYCAYDAPSLTKIQIASEDAPGVNPLSRQKIIADLENLETATRAILFVHWGIENSWVPPSDVVDLAEDLLRHPKVAGIIGTHPHRVQGYTSFGCKRAYFSIGDFLIPDFYLKPPVSVTNVSPDVEPRYETNRYHPVTKLTRKTRTATSRVSLLVTYDTRRETFGHTPLYQTADDTVVRELTGKDEQRVRRWVSLSKRIAEGPRPGNRIALRANRALYTFWNSLGILLFLYRQNGARWFLEFLRTGMRAKLDPKIDANDHLYEFFAD